MTSRTSLVASDIATLADARMWTTKSAVCRLERDNGTRPTLRTIENCAFAVGERVDIRVRPAR